MRVLSWMVIGAALVGCAAPVEVGGFHVNKEHMDASFAKVKARAAFDMGCPAEKLQLTILDVMQGGTMGDAVRQIGVTGCEHKGVYVLASNGAWVLNSSDGAPK